MTPKRFEPKFGEKYYYVDYPEVNKAINRDSPRDKTRKEDNNCFKRKADAALSVGDFRPKRYSSELAPVLKAMEEGVIKD
jgi:dethiobiotin synthetase